MKGLQLARPGERLSVLCLGAHSDDIEIGAGGTLLSLIERGVQLDVHWCVLSGGGIRDASGCGFGAVAGFDPIGHSRRLGNLLLYCPGHQCGSSTNRSRQRSDLGLGNF